jgi:hypothetical protein
VAIRPIGPGSVSGDGLVALLAEMRDALIELQAPTKPAQPAGCLEADLPPASDWTGATFYLTDKQKVALSNGTTWTDTTGGAL